MALKDTDHDMIAAAMAARVERFKESVIVECSRCGAPCKAEHMRRIGKEINICPDCIEYQMEAEGD